MTDKRFTTNGYYIYDHFKEDNWLVNEVEAEEIVTVMNNLDTKARERSKALSKLQKENEQLKQQLKELKEDVPLLLAFYRWYPFAVEKKEHQAYNRLWDFVND